MKCPMPLSFFTLLFMLLQVPLPLWTDEVKFEFYHVPGEVTHADSLVDETVYTNGLLSHHAEIDEFSVSTVRTVDQDGNAIIDSSFRTVERVDALPGALEWISEETVRLQRDALGELSVPPEASRPVLRNVPRFPDYAVKPGDSWSLPAEEVHVFRIGNSIFGPLPRACSGSLQLP